MNSLLFLTITWVEWAQLGGSDLEKVAAFRWELGWSWGVHAGPLFSSALFLWSPCVV